MLEHLVLGLLVLPRHGVDAGLSGVNVGDGVVLGSDALRRSERDAVMGASVQ